MTERLAFSVVCYPPCVVQADSKEGRQQWAKLIDQRCCLISALPQLGKTGCYTYILCRLQQEFGKAEQSATLLAQMTRKTTEEAEETKRSRSRSQLLGESTRKQAALLEEHYAVSGIVCLQDYMRADDHFRLYHAALGEQQEAQRLNRDIAKAILRAVQVNLLREPSPEFFILDAGCGMHGIIEELRREFPLLQQEAQESECIPARTLRVHGIDVHDAIREQNALPSDDHTRVAFTGFVDDMLLHDAHPAVAALRHDGSKRLKQLYDCIVFNLSLLPSNVSSLLKAAHRYLAPGGMLFIGDLKRRLPPDFKQQMQKAGFRTLSVLQEDNRFYKAYEFMKLPSANAEAVVELLPFWSADSELAAAAAARSEQDMVPVFQSESSSI